MLFQEECNEAIIWNIFMNYPLALICRDNECLDVYNLESAHCVKSLKHESKVRRKVLERKVFKDSFQFIGNCLQSRHVIVFNEQNKFSCKCSDQATTMTEN